MSAVVMRLPTARVRKVHQPSDTFARSLRQALIATQPVIFARKGDGRSREEIRRDEIGRFDHAYADAAKAWANIRHWEAVFLERNTTAYGTNYSEIMLKMSGSVYRLRCALQRLAHIPAPSSDDAIAKREIISEKWLSDPDPWYDQFRESVAKDGERFGIAL